MEQNIQKLKEYLKNIEDNDSIDGIKFSTLQKYKEKIQEQMLKLDDFGIDNILYPHLNDPNFNTKVYKKKEFNDLIVPKHTGSVVENIDKICEADFELAPHQIFVRNFLSSLTPYNSLLLYHGLGTGKTCSAITVCEEMRTYMKQIGITKKIIIVASPNVQQNFRSQIFDDRKLVETDGLWSLKGCTGNRFIREINPMSMKGLSRKKVIKQVRKIINQYYTFMGYIEFSNYISKIKNRYLDETSEITDEEKQNSIKAISKEFSNRLIVIDEVHNIRYSSDNPKKSIAENLQLLVKHSDTLKLLLLSATPMFNSAREIVWLTNLMNLNDNRYPIKVKDVFDKNGSLKVVDGKEVGKDILLRKLRGYVSYLRGENPFSFPYRIYPLSFIPEKSVLSSDFIYPRYQINGNTILEGITHLDIFLTEIGSTQKLAYSMAVNSIKDDLPSQDELENNGNKGLGWKQVGTPLQCLNMVYPSSDLDTYSELSNEEQQENKLNANTYVGTSGLNDVMDYKKSSKSDFNYKPETIEKYGRIFNEDNIGTYSGKISNIIQNIKKSKGIVIVYSQYIDGGCIPIALALEEAGFQRHNSGSTKSLFDKDFRKNIDPIDALTMKNKKNYDGTKFKQASYVMITGNKQISPNNKNDVKAVTNDSNINGEDVKVVIISEAGSEGIDFNNIRQVHILDPWYNMSRIEQIIGRGVRFKSHCKQPIENRNVEIYLYGSYPLEDEARVEPLDLYIYRLAEYKALQIGIVSRILKETAVDCLLNMNGNALTAEELDTILEQKISSGKTIQYRVGDKALSQVCDYMEKCNYKCYPDIDISELENEKLNYDTYDKSFINLNTDKIVQRIRDLYKERFAYTKQDIIYHLTQLKEYPLLQIDNALQILVEEKGEFLVDMFGRLGKLVNINDYYLFQPIELKDPKISNFRRRKPIEYKHDNLNVKLGDNIKEYVLKGIPNNVEQKLEITDEKVSDITDELQSKMDVSLEKKEILRGKNEWKDFVSTAIEIISMTIKEKEEIFEKYILHHYFDILPFSKKKLLIEYLLNNTDLKSLEKTLFKYIEKTIIIKNNSKTKAVILSEDNDKIQLWIMNDETNILEKAKPTDIEELKDDIKKMKKSPTEMNSIVGFISYNNRSRIKTFKTKDMYDSRSSGARCDQAGKQNVLKILNSILDNETFTKQNTRTLKTDIFCIVQELLLRYYNDTNENDLLWFFNFEQNLLNEVENITKKN